MTCLFIGSFTFIEAMYFQCIKVKITMKTRRKKKQYKEGSLDEIISKSFAKYTCSPPPPTSGAGWELYMRTP